MRLIINTFCFLFFFQSFSQNISNQEKIKNYIDTYFHYDRENIHVQFNKNIYVNTEDLAFKGYVFSKNNNAPHANTTNVQLVIYNEKEEIVQKQLLFTNNGTFSGGIHLNDKFKTGKYYFHFFTNWMRNFKEDDSFTQEIEIIDKNEPYNFKTNEPNWKTAAITLHPEGGSIVNDINNTIGINIKDCNQKGIEIKEGIILDSKSNEVSRFHTNKMGNGVFYLIPKSNETYTLNIKSEKLTVSQPLPRIKDTGIIVTYNNNLPKNKLMIGVKTNEKGIELYQNKKFFLMVHQDGKSIQQEINFNNKETTQTLILDKQKLSNGVNSIRLINEDLNEITERLVYIYPTDNEPTTTLKANIIANDSIALSGKTGVPQANLSISVLPENNICMSQKRSIVGTFYLNAYLESPLINNYAYYDLENKDRKQDIELLMLNQNNSKYNWENIKSNPPKINHPFDKGVTISGKVENKINTNSKNKITLVSFKDKVFDETTINNNDFKFENFFAQDSTIFILQMVNEKNLAIATKMKTKVSSNQTMFALPLRYDKTICPIEKKTDKDFTFTAPKLENSITQLKGVTLINAKKDGLTHKTDMSSSASAYKVKERDYGKVLDYIGRNGFRTGVDPNDNTVFIKSNKNSYLGDLGTSPAVYLDNDLMFDYNLLFNLYLNEVDEIYIDPSGASDTSTEGFGTIKIFLKDRSLKKKYFKIKYTSFIVTNGFAQNIEYQNSLFETQNEYYYFGTMNWSPNVTIKDNSNYEIKFPKGNQKEIQVLVEGFSNNGQLISEIKTIPVSNSTAQ
ncbi:MAG TPA: hypothetical protein VIV55_11140 [Flavobacterium sp.]